MAKKIYIGEILGQVNSAIAALQVDMGTMSGDMADMVTELIAVKNSVVAGIATINVDIGTEKILELGPTSISVNINSSSFTKLFSIACFGKGKITVNMSNVSSGFMTTLFAYSYDGVNWFDTGVSKGSAAAPVSLVLPVNGNTIFVGGKCQSPSNDTITINGTFEISYKVVDVVNDGAFVLAP